MRCSDFRYRPEHYDGYGANSQPHLLPDLKRRLRDAFYDKGFLAYPPPQGWLKWDVDLGDTNVLKLNRSRVAIGNSADHQRLKNSLSAFLHDGFKEHQARFFEIDRLCRNMMLLEGIVARALGATTEKEIRCGICPACPYPKAALDTESASIRNSIETEEIHDGQ